jgi:hypothetical protein
MDDSPYIIEISKSKRALFIKVWSKEAGKSADLEVGIDEAVDLLGGSFEFVRFVDMLVLEDGKFILDVDEPGVHMPNAEAEEQYSSDPQPFEAEADSQTRTEDAFIEESKLQ